MKQVGIWVTWQINFSKVIFSPVWTMTRRLFVRDSNICCWGKGPINPKWSNWRRTKKVCMFKPFRDLAPQRKKSKPFGFFLQFSHYALFIRALSRGRIFFTCCFFTVQNVASVSRLRMLFKDYGSSSLCIRTPWQPGCWVCSRGCSRRRWWRSSQKTPRPAFKSQI